MTDNSKNQMIIREGYNNSLYYPRKSKRNHYTPR